MVIKNNKYIIKIYLLINNLKTINFLELKNNQYCKKEVINLKLKGSKQIKVLIN